MNTKMFENIFSKKSTVIKKEIKREITVDYREKNSLVASELIYLGFEVKFKELKVADYIINGVAIERKTISDFLSSMLNKRLSRQIGELKQYKNKLLIIEGIDEQELYDDKPEGINGNAIRGFLLSILLKHKIPVIFTKNYKDTARFMLILSKKEETESPLNAKKKSLDKKEQLQFILEGFPGIGPKTAKKLLKKFKNLKKIINTNIEELKTEIGKKAEIFKLVEENY